MLVVPLSTISCKCSPFPNSWTATSFSFCYTFTSNFSSTVLRKFTSVFWFDVYLTT
nr:MAG TPA: hypothetical protein [Caudoviricetes sp.]